MNYSVPTAPRERQAWVLFQLKLRGESFASIGARLGVSRNSVRAAMTEPSYKIEKELAKALELTPRQLFPERYDAKGRRLHKVRGSASERRSATQRSEAA